MTAGGSLTAPRPQARRPFETYRDDGPLARGLGALAGRRLPLSAVPLTVAGIAPLIAAMAIDGDGASDAVAGAVVAWFVVLAGVAAGRPQEGRLRWVVPPLVRLGEYAGIVWLASLAGRSSLPAAFALLAALAFRHYDLVYRMRLQGSTPPRRLGDAAGGWEGRLIGAWLLLALGLLPAGMYVAAGVLGAAFLAESVAGWVRFGRGGPTTGFDDQAEEEDA